jgi:hypothetical protein
MRERGFIILLKPQTQANISGYFLGPLVLYPKKGVCADPVDKGAILGGGGVEPHSSDRERQLAPDIGRGKT